MGIKIVEKLIETGAVKDVADIFNLTRQQILDAVWGYAADVDSERTVNVHIRRLREKVEIDPSRPSLILTVPGIGYRLVKG